MYGFKGYGNMIAHVLDIGDVGAIEVLPLLQSTKVNRSTKAEVCTSALILPLPCYNSLKKP